MKNNINVSRVFWSTDSVDDVLEFLQRNGIALFADTKSNFVNFYRKLLPVLPEGMLQDYTNHESEGYFYFIYDSETLIRREALDIIKSYKALNQS